VVEAVIDFERGVSHAARGGVRGGRGKEGWAMQGRQRKNLNPEGVSRSAEEAASSRPPESSHGEPRAPPPLHNTTQTDARQKQTNTTKSHIREKVTQKPSFRRSRLAQKPSCCRGFQIETLEHHQDTQKCTRVLWCVWTRTTLVSNCSRGRWQ